MKSKKNENEEDIIEKIENFEQIAENLKNTMFLLSKTLKSLESRLDTLEKIVKESDD
ncbi:MAG: hypothetical protein K9W44_02725 [Candidatus Lokiarchaeota archaeon]|nr:hypothetical protein [Candidatus Harpocratesius repetitus]